jgi:hypothetical protein
MQKTRLQLLEEKICPQCYRPLPEGLSQICPPCREKAKIATAKCKQQRINNGMCVECGKAPAETGIQRCQTCRVAKQKKDSKRIDSLRDSGKCLNCREQNECSTSPFCKKCREIKKEKQIERRANYKSLHLCRACGKTPSVAAGKAYCQGCILKQAAKRQLKDIEKAPLLLEIYTRQKGVCPYTGIPLTIGANASVDHIVPKSRGGTNEPENIQWVHSWVNLMKNCTSHDQFVADLKAFVEVAYSFSSGSSSVDSEIGESARPLNDKM